MNFKPVSRRNERTNKQRLNGMIAVLHKRKELKRFSTVNAMQWSASGAGRERKKDLGEAASFATHYNQSGRVILFPTQLLLQHKKAILLHQTCVTVQSWS